MSGGLKNPDPTKKRMEVSDPCDPYRRPARRTQWIVSTLAYHYGLDRGVENEIIVLATGLDQYLQEIFHHLDWRGDGKIPAEDFRILCEVLGLGTEPEPEESSDVALDSLPADFTFRHFHAKLCGYFSTKAGRCYENDRLLVGGDSEHIETQIRLRGPLRRRGKVLTPAGASGAGAAGGCRAGSCTRECYEEIVALEEAEDRMVKLEEENASLRELVEDMRAALQSSDARALALQVGLWKSHAKHRPDGGCFIAHHKRTQSSQKGVPAHLLEVEEQKKVEEYSRMLKHEQVEMRRKMEEQAEMRRKVEEQVEVRRRVEEARQALLSGLEKVKLLEAKASQIPALQRQIQHLETQLLCYRSEVSGGDGETQYSRQNRRCCLGSQRARGSPTGRAENPQENMEEQIFRSVEGQAASDEEEEFWTGEQHTQVKEVKKILTRLSCCGDRCDERVVRRFLSHCEDSQAEESYTAVVELLDRVTRLNTQLRETHTRRDQPDPQQVKDSLLQELQQRAEESEMLNRQLQVCETERVRLSLLEDRLLDVLQLLQQLRDLNVSRRSLGKILLSTLESCSDPQHGKAHILEVLNALCHELTACEILSSSSDTNHQPISSSLIISC